MTEAEWAACRDPDEMLAFLQETGKLTSRKSQLFRVAVARRVQRLLVREYVKFCSNAIEVQERHADGLASGEELQAALAPALRDFLYAAAAVAHPDEVDSYAVAFAADAAANRGDATYTAQVAARAAAYDALTRASDSVVAVLVASWQTGQAKRLSDWHPDERAITRSPNYLAAYAEERTCQAALLRDIFGPLPFRPVTVQGHVLAWNDRLVVRLAQAVYDEKRWGNMGVLADALLDAGCNDDEIIDHFREQGSVHHRGCWCLDILIHKS